MHLYMHTDSPMLLKYCWKEYKRNNYSSPSDSVSVIFGNGAQIKLLKFLVHISRF